MMMMLCDDGLWWWWCTVMMHCDDDNARWWYWIYHIYSVSLSISRTFLAQFGLVSCGSQRRNIPRFLGHCTPAWLPQKFRQGTYRGIVKQLRTSFVFWSQFFCYRFLHFLRLLRNGWIGWVQCGRPDELRGRDGRGQRGRGLCNAQLLLKSSQEAQIAPFYKRVTMSLQTLAMIQSWKL